MGNRCDDCGVYSGAWWHYKASHNSLLTTGLVSTKAFSPKDISETVFVDGLMFIDGVAVAVLSDGRKVTTTEYSMDATGVRLNIGGKWYSKRG